MEYTKEEIDQFKSKADKWDALDEQIAKFYGEFDDEGNEEEPEESGDLTDIGEVAARAFGYI